MPPERRRVPGIGVLSPLAMFVGEAPGRFGADRSGVPFVGDRSGGILAQMMDIIGLSVTVNVYVTNLVRCNPRDQMGRNRKPLSTEISAYGRFLMCELELVKPQVVISLGELATRFLLGRSIAACRSRPQLLNGLTYYPLYHPSYVARNAYPLSQYVAEFRQLGALLGALPASRGSPAP